MYLNQAYKTYLTSWLVVSIRWLVGAWPFYLRGLPPIWASRPDLFVADDGLHLLEGRVLTDEVEEGKLEVLRHPVDFAPETTDNRLQLFLSSGISQFCTTLPKIKEQ